LSGGDRPRPLAKIEEEFARRLGIPVGTLQKSGARQASAARPGAGAAAHRRRGAGGSVRSAETGRPPRRL